MFFSKSSKVALLIASLILVTAIPIWAKKTVVPIAGASSQPQQIIEIRIEGDWVVPKSLFLEDPLVEVGDEFSEAKLNREVSRIKDLGYFESVEWTSSPSVKGYSVTIHLKEFPQIGEIQMVGNSAIPTAEILATLSVEAGDILNPRTIQTDILTINTLYAQKGYLDSRVLKVGYPEESGDPLIFYIGERKVEEIRISGNSLTKPYVILREMKTKSGSVLQAAAIKEDLRRIFNLNYFTNVQPQFLPGLSPTGTILQLDVNEKRTGQLSFGGGYSPSSGFDIFTNIAWDNFWGTGQTVMLNGNFGRATTYQFKYYNPWMWDDRQSFSFRLWSRNGGTAALNPFLSGNSITYRNEQSTGTEFGFGFPLNERLKFQHNFKFERVHIDVPSSNSDPSTERNYSVQSYTFQTVYDTRDVWFNPTEGQLYTASVERAFQMVASSLDYTRFDLDMRFFHTVVDKQVLATRIGLGHLQSPLISDQNLFARELYRMGGGSTVRGYDDFNPFAVGNNQVMANIEYRFLFEGGFQFLFFLDMGYATNFYLRDNADGTKVFEGVSPWTFGRYRIGKGLGIRFEIPQLGPIRLDLGIDDQGSQRIHFSMGQTF